VWDVAGQRGTPIDDVAAGLTEGWKSHSCQRMRMMTRKIERKKEDVCEGWVSFVCWPLWTLSAMSNFLRPCLPDCARYPRLPSMPQVVGVLGPLLADWDLLHSVVGGGLAGGLGLWWWWELAAEVVGAR
jgi:hypothetical protein